MRKRCISGRLSPLYLQLGIEATVYVAITNITNYCIANFTDKYLHKETMVDNEYRLTIYTPIARCITHHVNLALNHYPEYMHAWSFHIIYGIVRDFLRVDAKRDTIIRQHEDTIRHRVAIVFFNTKKKSQKSSSLF